MYMYLCYSVFNEWCALYFWCKLPLFQRELSTSFTPRHFVDVVEQDSRRISAVAASANHNDSISGTVMEDALWRWQHTRTNDC